MKLSAPRYYLDFACIADRCRHSCCVGWEIDIDGETLGRYEAMDRDYAEEIRKSICREDTPHFALRENDRCPHLAENGLCKIILRCGEDSLCEICREHPRFYHRTVHGLEVGLGMSCEEAARIILNAPDYGDFVQVGEEDGDVLDADFDATVWREAVYARLSDTSLPYCERLLRIYRDFDVCPGGKSDAEWIELLSRLEYLDASHRELFFAYSSEVFEEEPFETVLLRALAYFVFRHCSDARDNEEFCASLGFSLLCERLLSSMLRTGTDAVTAARILSEELEYSEENTDCLTVAFLE